MFLLVSATVIKPSLSDSEVPVPHAWPLLLGTRGALLMDLRLGCEARGTLCPDQCLKALCHGISWDVMEQELSSDCISLLLSA